MKTINNSTPKIICLAQKPTTNALAAFIGGIGADWYIENVPDSTALVDGAASQEVVCALYEVGKTDIEHQLYAPLCETLSQRRLPVLLITDRHLYRDLFLDIRKTGYSNVYVTTDESNAPWLVLESIIHACEAERMACSLTRQLRQTNASVKHAGCGHAEQFYFLLDTCGNAVLVFEFEGKGTNSSLKEFNEVASNWLGYTPDITTKPSIEQIFNFGNTKQVSRILADLRQCEEVFLKTAMIAKNGGLIPVEVSAKNFSPDKIKHYLIIVARRLHSGVSEPENPETRAVFSLAQEQGGVLMYECNLKTQHMIWGGEVEEVTGYTPRELKQRGMKGWREHIAPDDYHHVITTINEAIGKLGKYHLRYRIVHKSGDIRNVEDHGAILPDDAGGAQRLLGTIKDITVQVEEEQRRLQLEQEFQHSQRIESLGVLAGGIAHDFNNILAGIIGLTDLALREVSANSYIHEDLTEVLQAANRAKELVKQILAFSRQSDQEKNPLYLHIIAREVIKFLRASLPPTIEIIDMADVHSGAVMANAAQMYQVITNFCTNAAHAIKNKSGKIEVRVYDVLLNEEELRNYAGLKPGPYVSLSVQDTGHGMSKSVLARAFDPFFTTKGPGEGTGMGLAVVHGIITDHGGAVTAESRLGVGSIFHVFLPRIGGVKVEDKPEQMAVKGGKERILFVDDDIAVLHFANLALPRFGFKISLCMDGEEGLHKFLENQKQFDLVITDQIMPKMSGLELAKKIHEQAPRLPILLFTGFSDEILPQTLAEYGIAEVVYKPIVIRELVLAIRRAVDNSPE